MGLSALDDPNCHPKQHTAPKWAEDFVKTKRKQITTRCKNCDSIITVEYKPTVVVKEEMRGWAPQW